MTPVAIPETQKKVKDPLAELTAQVRYYKSLGFPVPMGIKEPDSMENPVLVNYGLSLEDVEKKLGIMVSLCGCKTNHQDLHHPFHQWGWIYRVDLGRKTRGWPPERAEEYQRSHHLDRLKFAEGMAAFIKESMFWQKEFEQNGHDSYAARKLARIKVLRVIGESECNNFIPHFIGSQCVVCQKAPALYLNGDLKVIYFQISQNPCWGIGYKQKFS
ncbi:MAG TPA: hypothetical protein VJH70_03160 [Candidatus Paceibacterota bacterium]